jgi:SAM-dependent methyltransferase
MAEITTGPSWTDIADWYDELIGQGSGPHDTAVRCLLALVPDPAAADRVLDVGCGQGLATRALVGHGFPSVIGADASERMLEWAREHWTDDVLRYVLDDAQQLGSFADRSFTGVTCQLALMDIPDLESTLAAVSRVLEPGGWFAFVIGHPCFLAPDAQRTVAGDRVAAVVFGYFDERFWRSSNPHAHGVRRAGNHHRMLSTYLNALHAAGLILEECQEPRASALLAEQNPLYGEVPIFFAARYRKPT